MVAGRTAASAITSVIMKVGLPEIQSPRQSARSAAERRIQPTHFEQEFISAVVGAFAANSLIPRNRTAIRELAGENSTILRMCGEP